ncbi:MAG: branched-chain amino acid ABC transporter permease [Pseudanabaenaceae cyanobacterium]
MNWQGILDYSITLAVLSGTLALFSIGLNLQWGMAGLVNFGHVAFLTIGAYTTVLLTGAGVPWLFAMVVGALLAGLLGLGIGMSSLRLREDYLGMVTIGTAELLRLLIKNDRPLGWLTRGDFGIQNFPRPFAELVPANSYPLILLGLLGGTLAVLFVIVHQLSYSPWGRVLKAIREDEEVATALGKNVFIYKLQAFVLGGGIAGIAGAFYAWYLQTLYPKSFEPEVTFQAWMIVAIGGAGNNLGVILGAIIFQLYNSLPRFLPEAIKVAIGGGRVEAIQVMLIGLTLVLVMLWRPQGILGRREELSLHK